MDLDAERPQELLGDRAARHARSRLTRAGALKDVSDVAEAVLLGADEIGVTGPGQVDLRDVRLDRPRAHPLLPVGVVAVVHLQRDRPAKRSPMTYATGHYSAITLDLHPAATAVAELTTGEVAVDRLAVEHKTGRHALDDAGEPRAVGLAGGGHPKRHRIQGYGQEFRK